MINFAYEGINEFITGQPPHMKKTFYNLQDLVNFVVLIQLHIKIYKFTLEINFIFIYTHTHT